jgi:hypothetical protein
MIKTILFFGINCLRGEAILFMKDIKTLNNIYGILSLNNKAHSPILYNDVRNMSFCQSYFGYFMIFCVQYLSRYSLLIKK